MKKDVSECLALLLKLSLTTYILERDNYTCFMSGVVDRSAPKPRACGCFQTKLKVAHIFKHAATAFDASDDSIEKVVNYL